MTIKLLKGLMFAVLALAITACGSDDNDEPAPEPQRTYTNTVFIYMPWTGSETSSSGSLTDIFHNNITSIEAAIRRGEGDTQTRTIVLLASSNTQSTLFEINDDGTETTIETKDDGSMTTTAELTDLLNEVAAYSPTPTYSILIGSHGSGWLPAGSTPQTSRSFGGQTAGTQTEISTLADAINQSRIRKMQYICFDDCYMANIETAYALRNATNWLVASTSEVMDVGLPYSEIWKYLSKASADYAGIVNGFGDFYSSYAYPYGELSAIDCTKAEQMASLMKELNKKYEGWNDFDLSTLQALDGYTQHVFYDMGDYINKVCGSDTLGNKQIYDELAALVPYKFCTPKLYSVYQGSYTFIVRAMSGIAISDPSENASAIRTKTQTEWWKATRP